MKWSTLKKIYGGIIGNSIFLLSLFSILAAIPVIKEFIKTENTSLSLIGSLIISISFIINRVYTPEIISTFENHYKYYLYILELVGYKSLDYVHEFSILEDKQEINNLSVFKDKSINLYPFKKIDEYRKNFGDERSLFFLSLIKYDYVNHFHERIRKILTALFMIGLFFIYLPAANRILKIIFEGVFD